MVSINDAREASSIQGPLQYCSITLTTHTPNTPTQKAMNAAAEEAVATAAAPPTAAPAPSKPAPWGGWGKKPAAQAQAAPSLGKTTHACVR